MALHKETTRAPPHKIYDDTSVYPITVLLLSRFSSTAYSVFFSSFFFLFGVGGEKAYEGENVNDGIGWAL